MYKISQYIAENTFFDKKSGINKTLIYSTLTSKLICIDHHSWIKLRSGNDSEIKKSTLERLKKIQILVDKNTDELAQVLKQNQAANKISTTLYTAIQPSANCSLGCGYCGQKHTNDRLKIDLQQATIDRLEAKLNKNNDYKYLSIGWFGAEPLQGIHVIRKLTPKLFELCKKYNLEYSSSMVTNGLSLSDYLANELVHEHKVTSFEITLDGSQEHHDQRRHLKTGGKTFQQIYMNLKNLVDKYSDKSNVTVRSNIDDRNKIGVNPLIDQLKEDGILDKIQIYFAPIHSWGNDADQLVSDKKQWAEQEIEWFSYLLQKGKSVNLLYRRRKVTCMATTKNDELIDPFGGIFNCTEVSLVPTYEKNGNNIHQIGHVKQDNKLQESGRDHFRKFMQREILENYPCHQCNIFPICGGACPKEWMEGRSPCPSIKYNIKERMMLSYIVAEDNNNCSVAS